MRLLEAIKRKQQSRDVRGKSLCNYQFVLKQIMLTARLDRPKCFFNGSVCSDSHWKKGKEVNMLREPRAEHKNKQAQIHTLTSILLQRWLTAYFLEDWPPLNNMSNHSHKLWL